MTERIKLSDLIETGVITPPFAIHVCFKGKTFKAKIDKDGFIILDGHRHTSLSVAGGIVRAAVSGKPADGLRYRRVNGWSFWKYKDANGKAKSIDELRKIHCNNQKSLRIA